MEIVSIAKPGHWMYWLVTFLINMLIKERRERERGRGSEREADEAAHTHALLPSARMDGEEAAADAGEKKRMQSGFNSRAGKENQGIIGKRRREGSEERMQEKRRRVRKRRRWWQWWGGGSKREGDGGGGGEPDWKNQEKERNPAAFDPPPSYTGWIGWHTVFSW